MSETTAAEAKDVVDSEDPRSFVWEMLRAGWRFSALYAFVELDLAGWLREGPLTVEEIAERAGLDRAALARLLRTSAGSGLVRTLRAEGGPVRYDLTDVGHTLRGDVRRSMRSVVIPQGAPDFLEAMGSLDEAVRNGKSPFAARFGSMYGYLASHPDARHHFDAHMATRSRTIAEATVAAYDFTGLGTIADIGGGVGTVLATILATYPDTRGLLFELEPVIEAASGFLAPLGVADRCELVAGDFFAEVPTADAYVLSNIVHNWNDEDALTILRNVRAALPAHGRVLLLDILLPEDDRPHLGKELDMRMLALYDGARERTESEYLGLLGEAGLRPNRVIELPYALSLVEALPR
ncbi:methyltransferase [Actinomadura harenae]|uniref:Hydroxyneurosporene methyltransferase n=1 Tax=Actinomadura harenae TaxID=2483351 RepID=A0A3M2LQH7_9ACTN|nr:methyltransferase [Actinomadura harenae]RMI39346.1 hydroxyneurosporene methyltransferase [Actinomadura harenae]